MEEYPVHQRWGEDLAAGRPHSSLGVDPYRVQGLDQVQTGIEHLPLAVLSPQHASLYADGVGAFVVKIDSDHVGRTIGRDVLPFLPVVLDDHSASEASYGGVVSGAAVDREEMSCGL